MQIGVRVAKVHFAHSLKPLLSKSYRNKNALFPKKRRKSLFWLYQLKSLVFGTAFGHVATRVRGYKN